MPELRKDPVVGRWVIMATERARRPGNIIDSSYTSPKSDKEHCRYCRLEQDPVYKASLNGGNDWDVCVVPFEKSFLNAQGHCERKKNGLYEVVNGYGLHEIVIETNEHIAGMADLDQNQIKLVIETYAKRIDALAENPDVLYVSAYKNYGSYAGGRSVAHSRSHIIAGPVNSLRFKEKLTGAKEYYDKKKSCVYCDLIAQEYESKDRVVFESQHFLAIVPFAARFLFEVWILPKKHHCHFAQGVEGFEEDLAYVLKGVLRKFQIGLEDPSYNYMLHTAPLYKAKTASVKWQTIEDDFHWHIEVIPRMTLMAGFEKGTEFYINSVPPEHAAEYLREVEI